MAISDIFKRKNKQPSNEEQMSARQSAARPTPQEELAKLTANAGAQTPSAQGINTYKRTIGKEQVQKAQLTLLRYKQGKANLERRIVENEQWYKLRHWECMRKSKTQEVEPTSAYLFNCIANKHAEAMDNYPSPNILPREEGDKQEAKMLSSIIPVILESCDFEQTYSDVWDYKLKTGTGVYGVFWDKSKCNGMGDVSIRKVDLINLFWESGITDIQQSRNVYHVELMDNDVLEDLYPQLINKLGGANMT